MQTPTDQVRDAFTKVRSLENWDFDLLWPIVAPLLVLAAALIAKKWVLKEYKDMKNDIGVEDDNKD